MRLSVVVVVYDMPNAAPRSLFTLSPAYQRGLGADEYEVIVVDNGSPRPLPVACMRDLAPTVRCLSLARPQPSPAAAANCGLALARGDVVGLILDGARLATPRLLEFAVRAATSHPRAVVTTVGWLLGFGASEQLPGDDEEAAALTEAILRSIDWPRDPYRLFEVARPDGSTGYFGLGFESGALFMPRALWRELGGVDERFDERGGGFAAPDLYARALEAPDSEAMLLLGEGTVHQPHGGISTDRSIEVLTQRFMAWREHYIALRGHDLRLQTPALTYFGSLPAPWRIQLLAWLVRETVGEAPDLADLAPRVAAALAADPTPQGTAWAELYAIQAALREARERAAAAAAEAGGLAAQLRAVEASWSWRLTAPLRWLRDRRERRG